MATPKRPGRRRPARPAPVAYQAKDILLKYLAQRLGRGFLANLGLALPPIAAALPAEIPTLTVRAQRPDLLFLLEDGSILHLEFQTTTADPDLKRFSSYSFAASEHHDKPIYTVVLYAAGISSAPERLDRGSHVYTVRNVYLGERDGEALVVRVREKLGRGERLSEADRVGITLLPLLRLGRPLREVLLEVARLVRVLPRAEREQTVGTMVGLAYNYLDTLTAEQLLEVLRMANALEQLIEQGIARGWAEGEARGRAEGEARGRAEGERQGYEKAVRRAIEVRFGAVPEALARYLAGADGATLERLLERVYAVARPEDLLAD